MSGRRGVLEESMKNRARSLVRIGFLMLFLALLIPGVAQAKKTAKKKTDSYVIKINKLQTELKKLTRFDDEDETLDQIEMLIDFFEKRENPMTEFEESAFESIVEKIVVIDQHELEFHLIGGIKFKENI